MCVLILLTATASTSFDTYERLDTGLKFFLFSWSSVGFLRSGFTKACFIDSGTSDEEKDLLTMEQRAGSRISRHDFSIVVGIGSRGQHCHICHNCHSINVNVNLKL